MNENGNKGTAAAGLAAHSKDAVSGLKASSTAAPGSRGEQAQHTLTEAAESAQDAFAALKGVVKEQPLVALIAAGALGWLVGRVGKYV
jgi:ElaB/YqjD/DUF883 family membrane-anchored ribosome-binding protein